MTSDHQAQKKLIKLIANKQIIWLTRCQWRIVCAKKSKSSSRPDDHLHGWLH